MSVVDREATRWVIDDRGIMRENDPTGGWVEYQRWHIRTDLDILMSRDQFAVLMATEDPRVAREEIARQLTGVVLDHFLQCANQIIERLGQYGVSTGASESSSELPQ